MSLIGCTERKTMSTLTLIDSLLEKDSMEEASAHLDALDVTNMSEEEKAYFYLLKTSYYKETNETCISDSFINKSIAYYEQSSDKKNWFVLIASEVISCMIRKKLQKQFFS